MKCPKCGKSCKYVDRLLIETVNKKTGKTSIRYERKRAYAEKDKGAIRKNNLAKCKHCGWEGEL